MSAPVGGELVTMAALQGKLTEQSTTVSSLTAALDSQVHNTVWTGAAADRFKQMWESQFKTTLNQLQVALNDAATEVKNRAEAIDIATR
jgi:uncharacterized protein YukE